MNRAADLKRLLVPLTVSCLLHAALAYVPWFGVSQGLAWPMAQDAQKRMALRTLDATLVLEEQSASEIAGESVDAGSKAGTPAERSIDAGTHPALRRTEDIGLFPAPAPTYYTTDQLTKRPQPTAEPELETPEILPILSPGTIILKLRINDRGAVVSVDVEKSDLPELVSNSAVAAFKNLRFVPGERDGQRVGAVMRVEVIYGGGREAPR